MILALPARAAQRRKRNVTTRWLQSPYAATAGGEVAMIRYLDNPVDDPDGPCYAEGWLRADKNRCQFANDILDSLPR